MSADYVFAKQTETELSAENELVSGGAQLGELKLGG